MSEKGVRTLFQAAFSVSPVAEACSLAPVGRMPIVVSDEGIEDKHLHEIVKDLVRLFWKRLLQGANNDGNRVEFPLHLFCRNILGSRLFCAHGGTA